MRKLVGLFAGVFTLALVGCVPPNSAPPARFAAAAPESGLHDGDTIQVTAEGVFAGSEYADPGPVTVGMATVNDRGERGARDDRAPVTLERDGTTATGPFDVHRTLNFLDADGQRTFECDVDGPCGIVVDQYNGRGGLYETFTPVEFAP